MSRPDRGLVIHANDTSGNEIVAAITVTVVREPPPGDVPFYLQPWFWVIAGVVLVGSIAAIGLGRRGKKGQAKGGKVPKGAPRDMHASREGSVKDERGQPARAGGKEGMSTREAGTSAGTAARAAPVAAPAVAPALPAPAPAPAPPVATMYCPACSKRTALPSPVDLATATCRTCSGPLSRVLQCPHCNAELFIDKDFFGTYGGGQIACSACSRQFLLKLD
nr:hypothetical protein [Candidatus Sigynarchaeum springense]